MLKIKKSSDRGYNKIDWLESFHSFSFANYYNPQNMNYSHLRVINEDKIAAHKGFGFHPHKDMEIITFMLDGEIEHRDKLENVGKLKKGNAQLMRAGTGIVHSEMNVSDMPAHLLQIWIHSDQNNLMPGWWEREFTGGTQVIVEPTHKTNQVSLLNKTISGVGLKMHRNGYIIKINEDIDLDFKSFGASDVYFHQAVGVSHLNGQCLSAGDAAQGSLRESVAIKAGKDCILLAFVFPE